MRNIALRLRGYTTTQLADLVTKYGPAGTVEVDAIPIGTLVRDITTGGVKVYNGHSAFVAGTSYTPLAAPVNTVLPVVTGDGTPAVGEQLTTTNGTWTGTPTPTFTYKWFIGAVEQVGQTLNTFTPGSAGNVTVQVTGTNSQGSATATSAVVAVA